MSSRYTLKKDQLRCHTGYVRDTKNSRVCISKITIEKKANDVFSPSTPTQQNSRRSPLTPVSRDIVHTIASEVDPKNAIEKKALHQLATLDPKHPEKKLSWFARKGPNAKLVLGLAAAVIAAGGAYYGYRYHKDIGNVIRKVSGYPKSTQNKIIDVYANTARYTNPNPNMCIGTDLCKHGIRPRNQMPQVQGGLSALELQAQLEKIHPGITVTNLPFTHKNANISKFTSSQTQLLTSKVKGISKAVTNQKLNPLDLEPILVTIAKDKNGKVRKYFLDGHHRGIGLQHAGHVTQKTIGSAVRYVKPPTVLPIEEMQNMLKKLNGTKIANLYNKKK